MLIIMEPKLRNVQMITTLLICIPMIFTACKKEDPVLPDPTNEILYTMPAEHAEHEGTWLQWPHDGVEKGYRDFMEHTWIEMASALQSGEKVHIVAYDAGEQAHIQQALTNAGVPLTNIDFFLHPTEGIWVRDNGPIFTHDKSNIVTVMDFGFNAWGNDGSYEMDNAIPAKIAKDLSLPVVDLNGIILEGGAIEVDGHGTMMATRSSVTHKSRNPSLTEAQLEGYFKTYLGITNMIWLDGTYGLEVTDLHIDGLAKFVDENTIITMERVDLIADGLPASDVDVLYNAKNANGEPYNFVYLPRTQKNVVTSGGKDVGFEGSYVNYYIGNEVILVPTYNDPNDAVAMNIIQGQYPNRKVVGIDFRDVFEQGGMTHCVTQQQPK